MSVFEIRSRITYRSLMNRTKDRLADQVMDLLREVDRLRERGDRLQGDLAGGAAWTVEKVIAENPGDSPE